MDDDRDISPEPDPDIPDQDEFGQEPFAENEPLPAEEGQTPDNLLEELDQAQKLFDQGEEQEDDGEALDAGEPPQDEPQPFDETVLPQIPEPDPLDEEELPQFPEVNEPDATSGPEEDFGGEDLSRAVSSGSPEVAAADEAQRRFEQMGEDIEEFHGEADAPRLPGVGGGGEADDDDDALRQQMDSDVRMRSTHATMTVDHARLIDELHERLERGRL